MDKSQIINEGKKVLKIEIDSAKTLSKIFNNQFYNIVKTIYNTKGRVVVTGIGKSGHIANKIAATLSSTGTPSQFVHPSEASHGDLGSITKKDCLLFFSNSGQSNELNDIINSGFSSVESNTNWESPEQISDQYCVVKSQIASEKSSTSKGLGVIEESSLEQPDSVSMMKKIRYCLIN